MAKLSSHNRRGSVVIGKALLLAVLFTCNGCASAADYDKAKRTAHRLEMDGEGVCSATAIGPRSLLTAAHCLEGAKVLLVDGQPVTWWIMASDGADHVLVRVSKRFKHWARRGIAPKQGDWGFVHGNPAADKDILRLGVFAGHVDDADLWDLEGYRGDSGAAIFNQNGNIVGMVSAGVVREWYRMTLSYDMGFTAQDWKEAQA